MSAPTRSASKAQSSPQVKPPVVLKKVAQRLSVIQWLALAAAAMLVSTALLFLQRPWTQLSSLAPGTRSLLLESIEWNSVRGLPNIIGKINAVAMQPGGSRVWIAGDVGLLAFSDDEGVFSKELSYDAPTDAFSIIEARCDQAVARIGVWSDLARAEPRERTRNRVFRTGKAARRHGGAQAPLTQTRRSIRNRPPQRRVRPSQISGGPEFAGDVTGRCRDKVHIRRLAPRKNDHTYSVSEIGRVVFQSKEPELK